VVFDFGALPPEINSGRIYSGPGSGPMMAAASAWDGVAAELGSAASGYGSVIDELTSLWLGPSSHLLLSAVTPYVSWIGAAAAQAEDTAGQARAAAAAYETAFTMTVPPPVIAANRVQLMTLVATNFFGQNAPAIMATEAQYLEMWAQDAAAMYGYAASSASAAHLDPYLTPPSTTSPAALIDQGVAMAQAAAVPAGASGQTASAAMSEGLSAASIQETLLQLISTPTYTQWPLSMLQSQLQSFLTYGLPTPANNWFGLAAGQYTAVIKQTLQAYFGVGIGNFGMSIGQQLTTGLGATAGAGGAWYPTPAFASLGAGGWQFHGGAGLSASLSSATKIGGLSVPASWSGPIPGVPGVAEGAATKVMSASFVSPEAQLANGAGMNAALGGGGLPAGARGAQRTGNLGVRYGFKYSVLARPPSAG
jgi:PPE-repeat protein